MRDCWRGRAIWAGTPSCRARRSRRWRSARRSSPLLPSCFTSWGMPSRPGVRGCAPTRSPFGALEEWRGSGLLARQPRRCASSRPGRWSPRCSRCSSERSGGSRRARACPTPWWASPSLSPSSTPSHSRSTSCPPFRWTAGASSTRRCGGSRVRRSRGPGLSVPVSASKRGIVRDGKRVTAIILLADLADVLLQVSDAERRVAPTRTRR